VQSKTWQTPQGEYELEIGWSSEDIVHVAGVAVTDGFTGHVGQTAFVAPPVRPVRPYSRVSTIGEISGHPVGRLLRAVVLRVGGYQSAEDAATALMIERSVDEMPLRTVALFSQGRVNLGMIDGLVDILNGRPGAAMGRTGRSTGRALRSLVARATG
jgi:beta-glucosidase